LVGNRRIVDDVFAYDYFIKYNPSFANLKFNSIDSKLPYKQELRISNSNKEIGTIKLDGKNYLIDLLYCDRQEKACWFRINGVLYPKIYADKEDENNKVDLDNNHKVVISNLRFNRCPDLDYCEDYHRAFDSFEMEVVKE